MRTPSLNKRHLLEAGWIRQQCAEPITAKCSSCGSPLEYDASDPVTTEKDCWVCAARGIPVYTCSRCALPVDCPTVTGERSCESVAAFESGSAPAFKPEGEIWFYRPGASGKIRVSTVEDLRKLFASGTLKPLSRVCQMGGTDYVKASEHPAFADLFGAAALPRAVVPPRIDSHRVTPPVPDPIRGGSDPSPLPPVPAPFEAEPPARPTLPETPPPASFSVWASLAFFLWGFISTGMSQIDASLGSNKLLIGGFATLTIVSAFWCFKIARGYVEASRKGGRVPLGYAVFSDSVVLRRWLFWSSVVFLAIFGMSLWRSSGAFVRLLLFASPISLPFIPGVRGALGSFALGCVFGFASLLAAAIPAGIASFFFAFDASKAFGPDATTKFAAIGGFEIVEPIPSVDTVRFVEWRHGDSFCQSSRLQPVLGGTARHRSSSDNLPRNA